MIEILVTVAATLAVLAFIVSLVNRSNQRRYMSTIEQRLTAIRDNLNTFKTDALAAIETESAQHATAVQKLREKIEELVLIDSGFDATASINALLDEIDGTFAATKAAITSGIANVVPDAPDEETADGTATGTEG